MKALELYAISLLKAALDASKAVEKLSLRSVLYRNFFELAYSRDYIAKSPAKALAEAALAVDWIQALRYAYVAVREYIFGRDAVSKRGAKVVQEVSKIAEYLLKASSRELRDYLVSVDYFWKTPSKKLADSIRALEVSARALRKSFADTSRALEYVLALRTFLRELFEVAFSADFIAKQPARALAELIPVADQIRALKTMHIIIRDTFVGDFETLRAMSKEQLDRALARDYMFKTLVKEEREALAVGEYLAKTAVEYLRDIPRAADYYLKLVSRVAAEKTRASEYLKLEISKALADSSALRDYTVKTLVKKIVESAVSADFIHALKMVVLVLRDFLISEFDYSKSPETNIADSGRPRDVAAKIAYTLAGIDVRRAYFFPKELRGLWDLILSSDHNAKVDACKIILEAFKRVRDKLVSR
jgi:hypothetical protein